MYIWYVDENHAIYELITKKYGRTDWPRMTEDNLVPRWSLLHVG
jgi:hypothetical protein